MGFTTYSTFQISLLFPQSIPQAPTQHPTNFASKGSLGNIYHYKKKLVSQKNSVTEHKLFTAQFVQNLSTAQPCTTPQIPAKNRVGALPKTKHLLLQPQALPKNTSIAPTVTKRSHEKNHNSTIFPPNNQ